MKHVYNTGKVQIGLRYEKPKNYTMSRDMERLQRGLLESRLERRAEAAAYLIGVLICTALAVVWAMK